MADLNALEERMGYHFRQQELLLRALTHSSYANEQKIRKTEDYERLEFLGDAVLEMVSSAFLYARCPKSPEGELSKMRAALVCESALFHCANTLGLSEYIRLGRGEEQTGGRFRESITADVMEAIIGAMYLDSGDVREPERFIRRFILKDPEQALARSDAKTVLQEKAQSKGLQVHYEILSESGPDHEKVYHVGVYIRDRLLAEGEGRSKKTASQEAAYAALQRENTEPGIFTCI